MKVWKVNIIYIQYTVKWRQIYTYIYIYKHEYVCCVLK